MRLINTKAHGIYDYLLMLILLTAPQLFDYQAGTVADRANRIVSIYILCTALVTNFEFGLVKKLPLKAHLYLDLFMGIFLASSPWVLSFSEISYKPQLVFGLSMIMVSLLTDRIPVKEVMAQMGRSKAVRKIEVKKQKVNNFPGLKLIHDNAEFSVVNSVKKSIGFNKI